MGRPRSDGTRADTAARRRGILMDYLKKEANGGHYWFGFSANAYALDRGENHGTISLDIKKLADEGKVEYTSTVGGGGGFMIRIPESPDEAVEAGAEEPKVDTLRKCPRCSTVAPDASARFCWKCGASLLSDRELLKEAFDRVLPKIARLGGDGPEMNEIMAVIGKVGKMAFEEVSA